MWNSNYEDVSVLKGKTIVNIDESSDELIFYCDDGTKYKMYHSQDCCESVSIDEIDGQLSDLLNTPILQSEEVSNADGRTPEYADSYTWTFYKFATIKGYVTIKWLGESNGYYSEGVDFVKL